MTFEEWYETTKEWIYSDHTLAKAAWEAAWQEGYDTGWKDAFGKTLHCDPESVD